MKRFIAALKKFFIIPAEALPFMLLACGVASAQVTNPNIPLTGNIGSGGIFPLLNAGTIAFTDTNHTMAYPEMSANFIKLTSSVPLTATRNLIAPLTRGFQFTVENATTGGQAILVIGASGTGVTIGNGASVTVTSDGTNYVSSGGTVTTASVVTANGFQGTVANPTSTPAITVNVDGTHVLPVNTGSAGTYLNGAGAYTTPAGSGNTTSTTLTTNKLPKANGVNSIIDSSITDNGTTVATTEPFSAPSGTFGTPSGGASAALPAGSHGMSCDETATGGVPATGVDYLRCDATTHKIVQSLNGAAEAALAGTIASSPTLYTANSQTQADSIVQSWRNGYIAFGDSITAGFGATTAYPTIVGTDLSMTVTNPAVSGDTCGDMAFHVFQTLNPTDGANPAVTGMCGTNEVLLYGTAAVPTFTKYQYALAAWAALSSTNKILAANASVSRTGSWTTDTTWANANGLTSTTGSTLTYSAQVGPSGFFYVWYKMNATAGAFTATVAAAGATDTVGGSTTVNTVWTLDANAHTSAGVGLARFAATPGTNAVVLTVSSGSVTILGFGFPPVTRYRGTSAPRYNMMNLTAEGGSSNAASIAPYNTADAAIQQVLNTDGLYVPLLDANRAMDPALDFVSVTTQNCTGGSATPIHPNQCGQQHLAQLVEAYIGSSPGPFPYTGNPLITGNLTENGNEQVNGTITSNNIISSTGGGPASFYFGYTSANGSGFASSGFQSYENLWDTNTNNGFGTTNTMTGVKHFSGANFITAHGFMYDALNSIYAATTIYGTTSEVSWAVCTGFTPALCTTKAWLDTSGIYHAAAVNVASYSTSTNCASSASPSVCGAAAAGSVAFATSSGTLTVATTAVTANSQIFFMPDSSLGARLGITCDTTAASTGNFRITARTAATSFQITNINPDTSGQVCGSYHIIN